MKKAIQFMKKLYRDERGAEGLEKILIIAAVALPLLGLLIFFRNTISEWLGTEASEVIDSGQQDLNTF